MKKFSIIIPIYNAEKYIENCLNSILKQNFKDYEIILVDDGSTDNSKKICENYVKQDSRIKLISKQNEGSGKARNIGISNSNGKYLYFPDSDDILEENSLQIINSEIENNCADIYVFSYTELKRGNKEYKNEKIKNNKYVKATEVKKEYEKYIWEGPNYIQGAPWNKVFKSEIVKKYNIEYPNIKRHQDEVFIARYIDKCETLYMSDKKIYYYYVNDTKNKLIKFPKNYFEIRTELYNEFLKIILPWNPENKKIEYVLGYSYLAVVQKCLEYTYNTNWKISTKERREYFRKVLEDTNVKKALNCVMDKNKEMKNVLKDLGISKIKMNLVLFQNRLLHQKCIFTLMIISKIKYKINKFM